MDEYKINLHLETQENGQILASTEDATGLIAEGRTIRKAIKIAQDVAEEIFKSYFKHENHLPSHSKFYLKFMTT